MNHLRRSYDRVGDERAYHEIILNLLLYIDTIGTLFISSNRSSDKYYH